MKHLLPLHSTSLLAFALLASAPALAQLRTGEAVYQSVCMACHDSGVAHAPKVGDAAAWKPLIEEGQHVLSAHAFVGVRAMPAQGGDEKLSLEEFSRAVAWLVRNSGGNWQDPNAAMMHRIRVEAEKRLDIDIEARQKLKAELKRQDERRR